MVTSDGTRVDSLHWGYNFCSGKRIEYSSPLVSRVPRSRACDVNTVKGQKQGRDEKLKNTTCDGTMVASSLASNAMHLYL